MYSSLALLLLGTLAAANPLPQGIDVSLINDTPDPTFTEAIGVASQVVTYDVSSLLSEAGSVSALVPTSLPADPTDAASTPTSTQELAKRASATCATQVVGSGPPVTSTDTPAAFLAFPAFKTAALNATAPTGWVQTFQNLQASNNALGYLGYTLLPTYDVAACQAKCSAISNNACMAFNIYFERDPTVNPDGPTCLNPPSTTYIKCAFWGGPISTDNAVNTGQMRGNFQVVIAGSNGYVNTAIATPAGYQLDKYYANKAVDATYDAQGYKIFLGSSLFTGPFMAQLCADRCDAQTAANLAASSNGYYADGSPVQTCSFFNTYVVYKNTPAYPQGQYCALYSEAWPNATYSGTTSGSDKLLIQNSYTFVSTKRAGINLNQGNKNGAVHQASSEIIASSLQPFCSSQLGYSSPQAITVSQTSTITPIVTVSSTITVSTATVTSTADPRKRSVAVQQAVPTPSVLSKYPATVISSACSLAVSSQSPSTTTVLATLTASASTQVVSVSTTATTVAIVQPDYEPRLCATNFGIQISAPNTNADGQTVIVDSNNLKYGYSTNSPFAIDPNTGALVAKSGPDASLPAGAPQGPPVPVAVVFGDANSDAISCQTPASCTGEVKCSASGGQTKFWACDNKMLYLAAASWSFDQVSDAVGSNCGANPATLYATPLTATTTSSTSSQASSTTSTASATASAQPPSSAGGVCQKQFYLQFVNTDPALDGRYLFSAPASAEAFVQNAGNPIPYQMVTITPDSGFLISTSAGPAYANYGQQGLVNFIFSGGSSSAGNVVPLFCKLDSTCSGSISCTGPNDQSVLWQCDGVVTLAPASYTQSDVENDSASQPGCSASRATLKAVSLS